MAGAPVSEIDAVSGLTASQRTRGLVLLGICFFSMNLGLMLHMAANVPFFDSLEANAWQQGYLEAVRESCGILSFFIIAILVGRSEPKAASLMMGLAGGGLACYYFIGGGVISLISPIHQALGLSLVWSFGLHMWMPLTNSLSLALARPGREGRTLGMLRAVGTTGMMVSFAGVLILIRHAHFELPSLFLIGGIIAVAGAVPTFFIPDIRLANLKRMPLVRALRPRYRLFCAIELLDGMRKQVFLLFAVVYLVKDRGIGADMVAQLLLISYGIMLLAQPLAGWLVDRLGERKVLSFYFPSLAVIFILYATVRNLQALYVIYIIDNVLFSFRVAVSTYANRIAAEGERTQLLAMGVTMNHIGAVTLPLVGGVLYQTVGYRYPFYCGAVVAVVSCVVVQFIAPRQEPAPDAGGAPLGA